jgi:hypothetical protein
MVGTGNIMGVTTAAGAHVLGVIYEIRSGP